MQVEYRLLLFPDTNRRTVFSYVEVDYDVNRRRNIMSLSFKFANLILNARLDAGLTQSEVAQAVSVSTRWIQRIEAGEKLPGTLTMLRLILFFDLDIEELRKEIGLIEPISDNRRRLFAKHAGK